MKTATTLGLIVLAVFLSGCGDSEPTRDQQGGASVAVSYDSAPLADVQVRLHAKLNGPPIAQAISDANGIARFIDPPTPEPNEYFVSLISIGDGAWTLRKELSQPGRTNVRLKPLADKREQQIELSRGSVRLLLPR